MENFIVSARKYRPQVFETVVGQKHVTNTLANAIEKNHLAQALLFTGPRGVGKTTCARILARMINIDDGVDPDQDFAFNIFELDAASNNSVDDIRNLIDQVRFAPQVGNYKVYIIDEVHMLSQAAFNAFLKTLEEPPKHAIFILATTEKHKIIPTILSRCQIFDFKRITVEDIASHLKTVAEAENINIEQEALHTIAQKADGALRDALSIFDRIVSFAGDTITYKDVIENLRILDYDYYFRTTDAILNNQTSDLLLLFNEILDNGFDGHLYISGLASHFRDLLVSKDPRTLELLEVGESTKERYQKQSQSTEMAFLLRGLRLLNDCDVRYKASNNPRLLVELALLQITDLLFGSEKKNISAPIVNNKKAVTSSNANQVAVAKATIGTKSAKPSVSELRVKEKNTGSIDLIVTETAPKTSPNTTENSDANMVAELLPTYSLKKRKGKSGFSISSVLKGEEASKKANEEEEEVDETAIKPGLPTDEISENRLNNLWLEYLEDLKKEQRHLTYNSLRQAPIKLGKDFVIIIELHSEAQLTSYNNEKRHILKHLREKLNNFSLQFEVVMIKSAAKLEPYTAQEKYDYMVKKNPHLLELRKKLNLDIE